MARSEGRVPGWVGFGWFRHDGGVNPALPPTASCRFLSFAERAHIPPFLRLLGYGVRESNRQLGRDLVNLEEAASRHVEAAYNLD